MLAGGHSGISNDVEQTCKMSKEIAGVVVYINHKLSSIRKKERLGLMAANRTLPLEVV